MSIRYRAARSALPGLAGRAAQRRVLTRANNDNPGEFDHEAVMREALRCFAEHGLGTLDAVAARAQAAHDAGDDAETRRWLAVCRTFDKRRAAALAARFARAR